MSALNSEQKKKNVNKGLPQKEKPLLYGLLLRNKKTPANQWKAGVIL